MPASRFPNTIGLFGTCGASRWRAPFIAAYQAAGIPFFNPQVEDWHPECAAIEARHLVEDPIVLFPVTGETYGTGSLAETGFSILQTLRTRSFNRSLILLIEPTLDPALVEADPVAAKESTRARALVRAHLDQVEDPNVYVVESLDAMLTLSLELHAAHATLVEARRHCRPALAA